MTLSRRLRMLAPLALALTAVLPACSGEDASSNEDDLTSVRARARELRFEGVVYVEPGSSDDEVLLAVHKQTKSAFGPLRTSEVMVNNRELKGVDTETFEKRDVTVVDTADSGAEPKPMLEVRYEYVDDAVVPEAMMSQSKLDSALLRPDYESENKRILLECTPNDSHAQDFATSVWYVFEPSLSSCRKAMQAEQAIVDEARAALEDSETQVSLAEVQRLYLPVTMVLGADKTNQGSSWPEYDQLYAGGVQPGALVMSLINGKIDHESHDGIYQDSGYGEWLDSIAEVFAGRPGFELLSVEGGEDISTYELPSGKVVEGLGFQDFIAFEQGSGFPTGLTSSDKTALRKAVGERISRKWITFELPARVKIGKTKERDVRVQLMTWFGDATSTSIFKHAIKNSDVFLYNGHSMIGFGPLDPRNFTEADFPQSYQILFIDGCVSYNYYEADYIPLKEEGTKKLDLITNALESPAWRSGLGLGRFMSTLIDGRQASWRDLLESAEVSGAGLRVVNGELDNVYSPKKTPIVVTAE
jgi:hypothetical protein